MPFNGHGLAQAMRTVIDYRVNSFRLTKQLSKSSLELSKELLTSLFDLRHRQRFCFRYLKQSSGGPTLGSLDPSRFIF